MIFFCTVAIFASRISEDRGCPRRFGACRSGPLLALLCKDEACAYVRSAEDGDGYQAWQALLRARPARNATDLLNQLLGPTFTSADPRINLRQWNKNAEEYATRTGECVSEGSRNAVFLKKIAPQYMHQHLMLNSSPLEYHCRCCPSN